MQQFREHSKYRISSCGCCHHPLQVATCEQIGPRIGKGEIVACSLFGALCIPDDNSTYVLKTCLKGEIENEFCANSKKCQHITVLCQATICSNGVYRRSLISFAVKSPCVFCDFGQVTDETAISIQNTVKASPGQRRTAGSITVSIYVSDMCSAGLLVNISRSHLSLRSWIQRPSPLLLNAAAGLAYSCVLRRGAYILEPTLDLNDAFGLSLFFYKWSTSYLPCTVLIIFCFFDIAGLNHQCLDSLSYHTTSHSKLAHAGVVSLVTAGSSLERLGSERLSYFLGWKSLEEVQNGSGALTKIIFGRECPCCYADGPRFSCRFSDEGSSYNVLITIVCHTDYDKQKLRSLQSLAMAVTREG